MRLINVSNFEFKTFINQDPEPYAILSHRWGVDEVVFESYSPYDLSHPDSFASAPSAQRSLNKIRGTCAIAKKHGLRWVWIDNCCINKGDQYELTKSINSMFRWYKQAALCICYLSDVSTSANRGRPFDSFELRGSGPSVWFTRGWTLQELLAPKRMDFFDSSWAHLGSRDELSSEITQITGIPTQYLNGAANIRNASVAQRMSWQASRTVTQEEDIAYSLIGILGVSLVPIYGEGKARAFQRLQEGVLAAHSDESIFAWVSANKHTHDEWGLLAPSVECFRKSGNIVPMNLSTRPNGGVQLSQGHISLSVPSRDRYEYYIRRNRWNVARWIPGVNLIVGLPWDYTLRHRQRKQTRFTLTLNCRATDQAGQSSPMTITLCREIGGGNAWRRGDCDQIDGTKRGPGTTPWTLAKRNAVFCSTGWEVLTVLQPSLDD